MQFSTLHVTHGAPSTVNALIAQAQQEGGLSRSILLITGLSDLSGVARAARLH
jgi:hypothetical protein